MKYQYCSNITFIMFWADVARFLQHFRNLSNSFINILAILQDFNGIFLKYSLNVTVASNPSESKKYNENMKFLKSVFFFYIIYYKILFVFLQRIFKSAKFIFGIIYLKKHTNNDNNSHIREILQWNINIAATFHL